MKANELRIGNLVLDRFGNILEVESINFKGVNLVGGDGYGVYPDYEFSELQPIQLTEEWLLKFGFEKTNLDGDNAWMNLRYRYLNFSSDESVEFKKVYLNVNKMDIICKYIHQLQNLYFALTGEELTIKEQ